MVFVIDVVRGRHGDNVGLGEVGQAAVKRIAVVMDVGFFRLRHPIVQGCSSTGGFGDFAGNIDIRVFGCFGSGLAKVWHPLRVLMSLNLSTVKTFWVIRSDGCGIRIVLRLLHSFVRWQALFFWMLGFIVVADKDSFAA